MFSFFSPEKHYQTFMPSDILVENWKNPRKWKEQKNLALYVASAA
jgi:hypothetical protein